MTKSMIYTLASAAIAGLTFMTTGAFAQDAESNGPSVSFSLTGATEYVWRGVEQSNNDPAIFGAINIAQNGFYAGAGAENVDFLGIDTEYDLWAGYAGNLTPNTTFDVGVVRYGYLDAPSGLDLDTVELKLGVGHSFGEFNLGATLMFTDDFFATEESAQHLEVNFSKPLAPKWTLSGSIGHQMLKDDTGNYTHWNLGAAYAVADNVTLDIRYIDSDADYLGGAADERLVAAFSVAM